MGEANRRGTYEQRKMAAIQRDEAKQAAQPVSPKRPHDPSLASLVLATAAMGGYRIWRNEQ